MGNNHSSAQVSTITVSKTITPAVSAIVTSVITASVSAVPPIAPATITQTVIQTSTLSLLSTLIPPSPNVVPAAATVQVTLTPAVSTVTATSLSISRVNSVATSIEILTQVSTATLLATILPTASIQQATPAGLIGYEAGRLESAPAGASMTATAMAASSSPLPSGLSTPEIVISSKKLVGPFAPEEAILGGVPTSGLDVPLTAVFLVMFIAGAVTHFSIHEYNGKRSHKFHLSDAVFDFCMVRTVTCTMRIVWAFRPNNNSVVLAALIFENAGVVVLFAVNVVLTQRMIRAINPKLGWNPIFSKFILVILISVPMIIVWNIVNLVVSSFTLNPRSIQKTKDLLLFGSCWTTFLSLFPILFIGFLGPSNPVSNRIENFGLGSFRSKLIIIITASALLFVGAVVRLASNIQIHPRNAPGDLNSKLVFYLTGFTLEIIVVYLYAASRFDLRFWVPDASTGPGDYSRAKSGFKLQSEDEEALFQEVDFKMRFSSGAGLPRDEKPQGMWDSRSGTPTEARWVPKQGSRWQDMAVDRSNATREQVRQAIFDLRLNSELVGQPVEVGDGKELLVYAFKCRRGSYSDTGMDWRSSGESSTSLLPGKNLKMPRKIAPPRQESWVPKDQGDPQRPVDVI